MGRKLKQKDLPSFREGLLKGNCYICPVCKLDIQDGEAVLDHDHKTGYVRNTIHRDCNILIGKVENYIRTRGISFREPERLHEALSNITEYIFKDYVGMPYHPKHRTPQDKEVARLRKRLKLAKREETKEKLRNQIQEVRNAKTKL